MVGALTLVFIGVQSYLSTDRRTRRSVRAASLPPGTPVATGRPGRTDERAIVRTATLLAGLVALAACDYVVVPPEASAPVAVSSRAGRRCATAVTTTEGGDLRVDLTIRNRTGDWSDM